MIGSFQAENITGCFAMAHSIGIKPELITAAISQFMGLKRRLEKRLDQKDSDNDTVIFDDIAHSPEKASSVLKNIKEIRSGKIIVVFEPNIGGREKTASIKYDHAFKDADLVVIPRLTKLKISSNDHDKSMDGQELVDIIGKTHKNVAYIEEDDNLINYLKTNNQKGDTIVFMGSHGFRRMIEKMIEIFKVTKSDK